MYQRMPRTQYACPPEECFEGVPTNGHRRGDANRSSFKLREDFNIDIEHEGHGSWQAPSFARVHGTAYSCSTHAVGLRVVPGHVRELTKRDVPSEMWDKAAEETRSAWLMAMGS